MKKITCFLILSVLSGTAFSQNGIENVIVEKYYVSDASDSIASDGISANPGTLPVGSITYRIYVDMLPGYKFQAAYGVPDHEMRIETSTLFYNNEDRGATTPDYSKAQADNNTVMLDSWLTVGAACAANFGVLKTEDDGIATVVNADGVLQNADPAAGIPLTVEDGLLSGTPEPVTIVGIDNEIAVFDAQNDGTNGPVFSSWNGSLACLNGATGPDSLTNQVLIAQITTNGILCFELNIQIGTPSGGVQNFVAENPVNDEILLPSLIYCSNIADAVSEPNSAPKGNLMLFPNPASQHVDLVINGVDREDVSYSIYDVTGRFIASKNIGITPEKHTERVDISTLVPGVYFVELKSGKLTSTQKLVRN